MTQARFEIAFEGEPFDQGEIDVRDFAPTLLALGQVVQAANRALNGDRAEAQLRVAATDEGSFKAVLTTDVSWMTDFLDEVAAQDDRVIAAQQLMDLLLSAGTIVGAASAFGVGLFCLLQKLNGKRPDKLEENDDNTTTIYFEGTTVVVYNNTLDLLKDLPTREAIEDFGKKLGVSTA